MKIEKNVKDIQTHAQVRRLVETIRKLKVGKDCVLLDYMRWDRIGAKVRAVLSIEGIRLTSRRQSGTLVKKTRVWRIS